ncbi:hypothetical protein [Paenibacillus sacheonensis]|uniref:Beta-galactosidase trimerisation domain-containing protein n=1 Tax=Paenibacillus sacheonensis TaxID=742054 RepID=A0A7X4YRV9_9BACL|nr:hypothetical protein [Paenibacillus sacheonensis]MBM7566166.1 hypothetical protein [Paenibacillus sacheonensis]NBC70374.1 hypothetical protein [Paenibacillus sacheonensis]
MDRSGELKLSFRIVVNRYEEEEQFQQLLSFLTAYKDSIDELAIFTEYWHYGYYPLDEFSARCAIIDNRIERLRAAGFRNVGVNMLATLGHFPEGWDWFPALPYQGAVGPDGAESTSSFCPNSDEFRAYIADKYRLAARTKPDFIWVDDDVRMFALGVDYACFCPACLDIYNRNHASDFTREQLVNELNASEGGIHRERWVQQNIETIERLLAHIAEAVHGVDASIELGLMTVSLSISTYTGADYKRWFQALKAVKARPGGGFFEDGKPFGFVRKIHETNRQIGLYPDSVRDIQYELENFPFQRLAKSVHITLLECTAAIMAGSNGVAFDALKGEKGSLEDYRELLQGIQASRPLWAEMERIAGSYRTAGLYPALPAAYEAKRNVENGNWFDSIAVDNSPKAYVLSEIGIPLAMHPDSACGVILSGNMPEAYSTEELIAMLSGGVLLDGRALEILTDRGLGAYCGVAVDRVYDNGVLERFTDDPLNGGDQGEERDARQSMSKGACYALRALHDEVRVLSRLISFTNVDLGPVSSVYENTLGGRVAVQGYMPWQHIHSAAKRAQLLRISDWLSGGRLPVIIDRCCKVVPFFKGAEDGSGWLVLLLNGSFDETGAIEVKLRAAADGGRVYELMADGSSRLLADRDYRQGNGEIILTLDRIGSWQSRMFYRTERPGQK